MGVRWKGRRKQPPKASFLPPLTTTVTETLPVEFKLIPHKSLMSCEGVAWAMSESSNLQAAIVRKASTLFRSQMPLLRRNT
jgi:hypothetical protein